MNPLVFLVPLLAFVCAQNDGLRVSTQQGDVAGSFSGPSVRQFLGVPYATAKRFQPPELPPKREQAFNASSFSDSCPQMLAPANAEFTKLAWTFNRTDDIFVPMSEDCLTVNIWSPSVNRKQNTAVMVWVHGGGFNWGTSRLPIYDGTSLVRDNEDVTIVSLNYRLNIFGQPNAPQLNIPGKPQNFGLLDIEAAVKWVYENIGNFGGDPERITLFGQSAGGMAIDAYALAHPNDTIVKGLIEQSGTTAIYAAGLFSLHPDSVPRIDTTTWDSVAVAVGCGDAPTAAQLECMQKVPSGQLQDAVTENNVAFTLVQDEITYFRDIQARTAAGNSLSVPLLVGATKDEFDVFVVAQELLSVGHTIPVLSEMISDIETALFTCPLKNMTQAQSKAGMQIFRYHYQAVFPNLSLLPELRAFHGSEIPIIFGTYTQSPIAATPAEIAFSKYMQSVWVGFARDPKQGLIDLEWPQYDPSTASLVELAGPSNRTGAAFTDPALFEVLCSNTSFLLDTLAGLMRFPGGN